MLLDKGAAVTAPTRGHRAGRTRPDNRRQPISIVRSIVIWDDAAAFGSANQL